MVNQVGSWLGSAVFDALMGLWGLVLDYERSALVLGCLDMVNQVGGWLGSAECDCWWGSEHWCCYYEQSI